MTSAVWTREAHLSPDEGAAARARTFVADQLRRHDLRYLVPDVQLVVSELVTNSLSHSVVGAEIDVTLEERHFCVVLTVHDESPALPVVRAPGATETGGRGLLLVDATSADWGVDNDPAGGKTVWVVFDLPPPTYTDWAADGWGRRSDG